jgi:UDPglucose 6-dehydrogenase
MLDEGRWSGEGLRDAEYGDHGALLSVCATSAAPMVERSVPDINERFAVSVVGLGRLGSSLAALLAARGASVIGVDIEPAAVAALADRRAPIREPGVDELLATHGQRITATTDVTRAVHGSDATFVVVPTPSQADGGFDPSIVVSVVRSIGAATRGKGTPHLIVVTSTVSPGTMEETVRPTLEAAAGTPCGQQLGLCYSPLFVALGTVLRDLSRPDLVLIGESDPTAGARLVELVCHITDGSPHIARMSFVNAELAKLAVNTFVTAKISFANMLAHLCERLPGGDVDAVTNAVGVDRRIGRAYLTGGLGYGGPCFPRDNAALSSVARRVGVSSALPDAVDAMNRGEVDHLVAAVRAELAPGGCVGILGLSYKPDTEVVDCSPGVELAQRLARDGVRVVVHDPAALGPARRVLGDAVFYAASMQECAARADVLVIATPWPEFARLRAEDFPRPTGRPDRVVILDCWRMLDGTALGHIRHVRFGIGLDSKQASPFRHPGESRHPSD